MLPAYPVIENIDITKLRSIDVPVTLSVSKVQINLSWPSCFDTISWLSCSTAESFRFFFFVWNSSNVAFLGITLRLLLYFAIWLKLRIASSTLPYPKSHLGDSGAKIMISRWQAPLATDIPIKRLNQFLFQNKKYSGITTIEKLSQPVKSPVQIDLSLDKTSPYNQVYDTVFLS